MDKKKNFAQNINKNKLLQFENKSKKEMQKSSQVFYKSFVSFNSTNQLSFQKNEFQIPQLQESSQKMSQRNFHNTLSKSQNYNFKMIQQPLQQSNGFQSFKSIISDLETNNKLLKKQNQDQYQNAQELIQCLNYNREQKKNLDSLQTQVMRTTFNDLQQQYKFRFKELHSNDKFIKKKLYDESQEDQLMLPIQTDESQFSKNKNTNHKLYVYSFNVDINSGPPTFQGSTLINCQNKLYLYGGRSAQVNNQLYELNLETWMWKMLPQKNQMQFEGRFGHQMWVYANNLFVFGGESKFNATLKIRECSSEILQYDFQKQEWIITKTSSPPQVRRNFGSCLIGNKYLMIYGGLNPHGQYLKDTYFLNMDLMIWETYNIDNDIDGENGIAFHSLVYIQKSDQKINSLFANIQEVRPNKVINKIKDDAIITFGGRKPDSTSSINLRQCKIGFPKLKWEIMQTKGKGPDRRYNHTMNFQEQTQFLIIYGGYSEVTQKAMKDIFIINIQNLNWIDVTIGNIPLLDRFGHCSVIVNSQLIIFGGYDLSMHRSAQIQILEFGFHIFYLDQLKAKMRQNQQINNNAPLIIYQKKIEFKNIVQHQIRENNKEKNLMNSKFSEIVKGAITQSKFQRNNPSFLPEPNRYFLRAQSDSDFFKQKKK